MTHAVAGPKAEPSVARAALLDLAGLLALAGLAWANLSKFDTTWDSLYYHLPFAALRVGLTFPAEFIQRPDMAERMVGFPPLADLAQGLLWRGLHRPEAATLLPAIAIATLAAYVRIAFRVSVVWTVLVFAAIPILHTALDSGYVDLWTNAFFALHLLAGWRALDAKPVAPLHAGASAMALVVATESKLQFVALGAVSAVALATLLAVRVASTGGPNRRWGPPGAAAPGHASFRRALVVFCVLAPLGFITPAINAITHANPFYPETVKILGVKFAGYEKNVWSGPAYLERARQSVRYALSMLEAYAVDTRPDGYNVDQSGVVPGAPAFRMGGSLAPLWITTLALAAGLLWRWRPSAWAGARIMAFAGLAVLVSSLPGANELRYFSCVEIALVIGTLAMARSTRRRGDDFGAAAELALCALLVGGAVFVAAITGLRHVSTLRAETLDEYMSRETISAQLDEALKQSPVVCYVRLDQNALLFSPLFHRQRVRPFQVVAVLDPLGCPAGSAIIR